MSKLQQLSSSVQHLAKQYSAVIEVGKFLESAGSLENLVSEIEARVAVARAAEATALEAKTLVEQGLQKVKDDAAEHIKQVKASAAAIVGDANIKAAKIVADAMQRGKELDEAVQKSKEHYKNVFDEEEGKLLRLKRELESAQKTLAQIKDEIATLRARIG